MDDKHKLFKKRQTVLDLGYAPGAWSQVAVDRVKPGGRVLGVDILPALPPKGCSTIQGDFMSARIRQQVREFLSDPERGRPKQAVTFSENGEVETYLEQAIEEEARVDAIDNVEAKKRNVDVVLSDMCEPWPLVGNQSHKRHLKDPWNRLMNTSGTPFRDHAGSMASCPTVS
jgi:21S rRNA (uridine2791-2'-O)-methyltransferase